jgi:ABC-type multidrug transport system fused ATPase/permease subunit
MSELSVSRKFLYDLDELYTKRRTKEITEDDFSIQRDALFAQEAKSLETMGPILITKQLEAVEANVASTVNQKFQKEEQEESARAMAERLAMVAEQKRIEREEQAKQNAIEAENKQRITERNDFRSDLDGYIGQREQNADGWQRWCNWLQIMLIFLTTATAAMAGVDGIPRGYVVFVGFAAATLGGILSYLQLQDKIYASRKALANLRLECQAYDFCLGDYQDRRTDPQEAYLRFSKKVTAIQAEQMLYEVELLNPKKQEKIPATSEKPQIDQKKEEDKQNAEKEPSDGTKEDAAK